MLSALLVHALVPGGFMPGPGGLVICPAFESGNLIDGSATQDMPGMDMSKHGAVSGHGDKFKHHDASATCAFAASAFTYAGPLALGFTLRVALHVISNDFIADTSSPRGTIVPSPLPRGPPALV